MTTAEREALRQQLIAHEGLRLTPYRCTAGALTIGVGRNLEGRGITAQEAMYLLDNDIKACLDDLATFAWFGRLNAVRQRALLDMRFQLGPAGFRSFTRTLAAVDRADYAAAADSAAQSKWAMVDTPRRAATVIAQLRTGTEA